MGKARKVGAYTRIPSGLDDFPIYLICAEQDGELWNSDDDNDFSRVASRPKKFRGRGFGGRGRGREE
jgi:hypothetical protein